MNTKLTDAEFTALAYYFRGAQTTRNIAATAKNEVEHEKIYYDMGIALIRAIRAIAEKCDNNFKTMLIYIGDEGLVKLAKKFLAEKFAYTEFQNIKLITLLQTEQESYLLIGDIVDDNNRLFFNKENISDLPTMKNFVIENAVEIVDAKEREIYQNLFLEITDTTRIYKIAPTIFEKNYQQQITNLLQETLFIVKDALSEIIQDHLNYFKQGYSDQQIFEFFRDQTDNPDVDHDYEIIESKNTTNSKPKLKVS